MLIIKAPILSLHMTHIVTLSEPVYVQPWYSILIGKAPTLAETLNLQKTCANS